MSAEPLDGDGVTEFKCRRTRPASHTATGGGLLMLRTVSDCPDPGYRRRHGRLAHADADVYRWKDAQGDLSLQRPVGPGLGAHQVHRPAAPDSSGSTTPGRLGHAEHRQLECATARAGGIQRRPQAVKEDVAKVREQQCKEAKDAYDKAIHARRIYKDRQGRPEASTCRTRRPMPIGAGPRGHG